VVKMRSKDFALYIGVIHAEYTKLFPYMHRTNFAQGTQNCSKYIGKILRRVRKISPLYIGLPFCAGVCYFTASIPMHTGVIMRRSMQNYSNI